MLRIRSSEPSLPALMSRLRSTVGDNSRDSKLLLAHDSALAPFNTFDKKVGEVVQSNLRAPLEKLCNLQLSSITGNVNGIWSHVGNSKLAVPVQSLGCYVVPPPPEARNIQHTESDLSSPSTIARASNILTNPAVALTFHKFRTGEFSKRVTKVKFLVARSPITRPSKRPGTPFPVKTDARQNSPDSGTESLSLKRSRPRVGLPRLNTPPSTTHAAVPRKFEVRGCQTNLHQLARWLTGYIYFLISSPDRPFSWVTSGHVDFPAQEAAMGKILDILVHYHPHNALVFLALWYLERLFSRALVMSVALIRQDAVELVSRMFLLGLSFANKWLNDFAMSLKDWINFCSLPISSISELERLALGVLDHNISISNADWVSWLFCMKHSILCCPPPHNDYGAVVAIITGLLTVAPKVPGQYSKSRPKPISRPTPFELSSNLYSQVMQGLQAISRLHEPMPLAICEPAPWNPVNDPIIPRANGRTNGTAPGALPHATTAMDLLVSILINDARIPCSQHSNNFASSALFI